MIDSLDHLTIAGSVAVYETLLGRHAVNGRLQTGNVGLTFGAGGGGLSSMVFATSDLDKAARLLERRAVSSEREGDRLVLSREATHGVPIELCVRKERAPPSPLAGSDEAASISALDHLVVRTPNPERAIAFYAGTAGPRSAARPQQSGVGVAAAVLPLRRSRGRDRARPQEGRVGRARSPVGPELAHARHRPGERATQGGRHRRVGTTRRQAPGQPGLHGEEPHRRRAHPRDRRRRTLVDLAMRRVILVLVLLAAGCTSAPKPAVKSAAGLPPLGPCPASSWKPEAPPPTTSAKTSMVLLAVGEWARFGKQVITYSADSPPRTEQLGVKEREAPQRIQDYWASVGHPERSGLDDVPWSAAFISWDIQSAGVPRDLFCPEPNPHDLCRAPGRAGAAAGRRPDPAAARRARAAGRRPDLLLAQRQRHHPGQSQPRRRPLRSGGRAAARHPGRHRRQRGQLRHPQRLSTGRQRVFVAHIRSTLLHGDREHTALGKRACPGPTTTSSSAPARPAARSPTGWPKTWRCAS